MLRCSGAKRLLISMASSTERTSTMALFLSIDFARDGAGRQRLRAASRFPRRQRLARRFDVVSRIAEASVSCSACASMSAAIHRGSPSAAMIRISVGPGDEVDADFARQQLLRRRDIDVARPDDAIRARNGLRAISERGDGVRATHHENVVRHRAGDAVPRISGTGLGDVTQTFGTPATCAGITVIISVEGRG